MQTWDVQLIFTWSTKQQAVARNYFWRSQDAWRSHCVFNHTSATPHVARLVHSVSLAHWVLISYAAHCHCTFTWIFEPGKVHPQAYQHTLNGPCTLNTWKSRHLRTKSAHASCHIDCAALWMTADNEWRCQRMHLALTEPTGRIIQNNIQHKQMA